MHSASLRTGRTVVLIITAAAWVVLTAGVASADPAAPSPSPGIYGPLVGGGTMAPPPVMGPGLAPADGSDPSWWDVPGQIEKAIDTWFGNLVKSALEPVLRLIGNTLLSSPDVSDGRIAQIWTGVLITANTLYVLFVLAGAVIVMGHETVQTRYSIKEIAPRLVLGAVASNASLWAIEQTVSLGNALAAALTNGKLNAEGVGSRLTSLVVDKIFLPSGITQLFLVLLGGAVAVMGIVLLVTCVIRAAILLTLTAGAPLALACHALPQTDPMARLWWRAIIGCLTTQVAQALVLIICVQVFFDPNADTILGLPSGGGLVDLLLCLVLLFILIKIPIWTTRIVLGRRAMGATMVGRLARSFLYYKAFTAVRGQLGANPSRRPGTSGVWTNNHRPPPPSPGTGLVPFRGPQPGGGGGGLGGWSPRPETVTATASVSRDQHPAAASGPDSPRPPRPQGPAPRVPLGPTRRTLALPPGRSTRLDRLAKERSANPPPPRGVQYGLFPPVTPTTPRTTKAVEPKPAPLPLAPVFLAPPAKSPDGPVTSTHPRRSRRRSTEQP